MKKEKKLIIANWKMNPETYKDAKKTFLGIKKVASKLLHVQTVVCPPFPFLGTLKKEVSGHRCVLGAQDMFFEEAGSYTGEVSPKQIKDTGAYYVILGHSERRTLGETDEDVSKKLSLALKHVVTPVICVGEEVRDRGNEYFDVIKRQVINSLAGIPKAALPSVVIAYEPLWAIGKNAERGATPEEVEEMIIFIKKVVSESFKLKTAPKMKFLYGGSVDEKNTAEFLSVSVVDGLLIGRASLDPKVFGGILKIANES